MRTSAPFLASLLLIFAATPLPAQELEDIPPAPEGFTLVGDPEAAREEYQKKCAICHGENGDGKGRLTLDPPARDLRDRERMGRRSDWEIYVVIRDGGKKHGLSPQMIPWGGLLTEQELHDMTAFIRSLGEDETATGAGDGDRR